jgi:hypothetical protein
VKAYKPLTFLFTALIALVWLVNGLFCKVLHLVPRHELIVSRILGPEYAGPLTVAIGIGEIMVAAWTVSGIYKRYNAMLQITLVAVMNILEFILAPDLLLFGRFNIVFAAFFITFIYINEFVLKKAGATPVARQ